MAGGGGTRFWPLSRKKTPKQLLNLSGKEVMVNEAVDRLARVADKDDIFIVTNNSQAEKMLGVTAGRIRADHILTEPAARNTSACIGYAALEIVKKYGDGIMVVTPSDAYIKDDEEFARVLKVAVKAAEEGSALVTVGIKPTFPATGYGYIKFEKSEKAVKKALKFVEKPDLSTAEKYYNDGGYVWNSGMFIWKASVILERFKELLPEVYAELEKIAAAMGTEEEYTVLNEVYPAIKSVSVDYGIMEKAENILVVPGDFGWNDVGSWDMLKILHEADGKGNVTVGDTLCLESECNVVYSGGRLVALMGVNDMIVVETPDAVLVCPKDKAQDVKKIVDRLKAEGREGTL